jgi:predicted O-methyltransferase YrrM
MSPLANPELDALLERLHAQSSAQDDQINHYFESRADSLHWGQLDEAAHRFLADKLVALDRDKALFCHRLCLALRARRNFAVAGLADYIDLREGDLRQTLARIEGTVDFVLMDIWEMARPAMELIAPHLRPGAVVIADNTSAFPEAYEEYFAFVNAPERGFTTQTLPFPGGLELTVKV